MDEPLAKSAVADIDRQIEDAMGRVMSGEAKPGDYGLISDLTAVRVELTEPPAFAVLEKLLAMQAA